MRRWIASMLLPAAGTARALSEAPTNARPKTRQGMEEWPEEE